MSGEGLDTRERVAVGTGPGIDLDLEIHALGVVVFQFDWLQDVTEPPTPFPTLTGITPAVLPPHPVTNVNGTVVIPWRAHNLLLENKEVVRSIYYTINEGLICELDPEDVITWDKRLVYSVIIEGTPGDRFMLSIW